MSLSVLVDKGYCKTTPTLFGESLPSLCVMDDSYSATMCVSVLQTSYVTAKSLDGTVMQVTVSERAQRPGSRIGLVL